MTAWSELDEDEEAKPDSEKEDAPAAKEDKEKSSMSVSERKAALVSLVESIVPSQMRHHAEAEACDLLMEVEKLDLLDQ